MTAQNSSDNALHVIQLAEFGMHDFTCETAISDADLSAGLVMTRVNDACQQLLPSKCHVDEWYNGVTCQSRAHYEQALLIQVRRTYDERMIDLYRIIYDERMIVLQNNIRMIVLYNVHSTCA